MRKHEFDADLCGPKLAKELLKRQRSRWPKQTLTEFLGTVSNKEWDAAAKRLPPISQVGKPKRCPKCKTVKNGGCFYVQKNGNYCSYCVDCQRAYDKQKYERKKKSKKSYSSNKRKLSPLQLSKPYLMQECDSCGLRKSITEFYANPSSKREVRSTCIKCYIPKNNELAKLKRAKNKEIRKRREEWINNFNLIMQHAKDLNLKF